MVLEQLRIYIHNNKKGLLIILVLLVLILYPHAIAFSGFPIINAYVKTRLASVGILFLIIKGLIPDQYGFSLTLLFLAALILASSVPFSTIVMATFAVIFVLKIARKI